MNEKVRIEVMRHFGYFMTESTGHLSEYLPWFRSSERALEGLLRRAGLRRRVGRLLQVGQADRGEVRGGGPAGSSSRPSSSRAAPSTAPTSSRRSETGKPFRLQGNVRNDGYITNLPQGCCVEVPGVRGPRGAASAARRRPSAAVRRAQPEQRDRADAGRGGRRSPAIPSWPCTPSPWTRSPRPCCTLEEIREMTARVAGGGGAVAAAVRGQVAEGHARHQRSHGREARRSSARSGPRRGQALREVGDARDEVRTRPIRTGLRPWAWAGLLLWGPPQGSARRCAERGQGPLRAGAEARRSHSPPC